MKRSRKISLALLGGLSAGAITGCAPVVGEPRISPESVYVNDYFVPGAGYYHAPFRAFYPQPYNYYDPRRKLYFYGGQWGATRHRSFINISAPSPTAALLAESARASIERSGFGSTSRGFHIGS